MNASLWFLILINIAAGAYTIATWISYGWWPNLALGLANAVCVGWLLTKLEK